MAELIPKSLRLMVFVGSVYLMASGVFLGKGEVISLISKSVTTNLTEETLHIKRSPIIFINDKNKNRLNGGITSGNCSDCNSFYDENHILFCCDTFTMCCEQAGKIKCPTNNICDDQGRFCATNLNCVNGEKCCSSSNGKKFKCCWSPFKLASPGLRPKSNLSKDC